MIDIGSVAAMIAMGFAFGTFFYELLRRPQSDRFRLTGISVFGVIIGEAVVTAGVMGGPAVLGFHPIAGLVSSFAAIYLDVSWQERKIWPWDIIGDLQQIGSPLKAVSKLKLSVGTESDDKKSKAA